MPAVRTRDVNIAKMAVGRSENVDSGIKECFTHDNTGAWCFRGTRSQFYRAQQAVEEYVQNDPPEWVTKEMPDMQERLQGISVVEPRE